MRVPNADAAARGLGNRHRQKTDPGKQKRRGGGSRANAAGGPQEEGHSACERAGTHNLRLDVL